MKNDKEMVTISIRLDADLKSQMESLCEEMGMSMSTAYMIFTKKCVSEHGIPFKVSIDPFYSKSNLDHLKRAIKELDEGRGIAYNPLEEGTKG